MSVRRFAVNRSPRIDTYLTGRPVILYPFRFLCVEEDLQILPDETAEHRLMRGRLAGIITRIERRWAGVRGIKPVGPEYVYLGDRPAEGMHVYRNRRHLLFWVEGNEFPFDFLGRLRKCNGNWTVEREERHHGRV